MKYIKYCLFAGLFFLLGAVIHRNIESNSENSFRVKYYVELLREIEGLTPQSDLDVAEVKLQEVRTALRRGDLQSQELRDVMPSNLYLKGDGWTVNYSLLIDDAHVGKYLSEINELAQKTTHDDVDFNKAQTLAEDAKKLSQKIQSSNRIISRYSIDDAGLSSLVEMTKVHQGPQHLTKRK